MTNRAHNSSRRQFIKAAAGAISLPWLLSACGGANGNTPSVPASLPPIIPPVPLPTKLGSLIGFGQIPTAKQYFIGAVDLDAGRRVRHQTDIDFLGHGLAVNPAKPNLAVISEKHGKGCVEWDMKARKVTRRLKTIDANEFYGHGAFTPDGKTLFLAESVTGDSTYKGVITVRDGDSYETLGEFPSHGLAPHDTLLVDDGRMLIITNGGGPVGHESLPCVTYVDVKSRELKRRLTFSNPRKNAGHLAITGKGELVVVSAPREGIESGSADFTGAISFYTPGGEMRTADDPIVKRMTSETLSVAIHEPTMVVAATNPAGDLVTFWDFRTGKLIKALDEFPKPRGISLTLNRKFFALTYAQDTHGMLIDAEKLEPVAGTKIETTFISGSHNYVYDLPA